MLTSYQNKAILAQLKAAGLKYQEVYEEMLDHFTIAIEAKMDQGTSFDLALNEVKKEFGGNKGIKHVEKEFYSQMLKSYRGLHWQHFRSHFQWPQALATLAIGGLVYALAFLLQGNKALAFGLSLLALTPIILSLVYFFRLRKKAPFTKNTAKGNLLLVLGGFGLNFLNILIFAPRIFFNEAIGKDILLLYPAFVSVIITLFLLHLLSFIKTLERVQFKTKA